MDIENFDSTGSSEFITLELGYPGNDIAARVGLVLLDHALLLGGCHFFSISQGSHSPSSYIMIQKPRRLRSVLPL